MKKYILVILSFSFNLIAQDPTYNFYFNSAKKKKQKEIIENSKSKESVESETTENKLSKPKIETIIERKTALDKVIRLNYQNSKHYFQGDADYPGFYLEGIDINLQSFGLSYRLTRKLHLFGSYVFGKTNVSIWDNNDDSIEEQGTFFLKSSGINMGALYLTEFGGITFEHKLSGYYLNYSNRSSNTIEKNEKIDLKTMTLSYSVGPTLYFKNFIFNIGVKALLSKHKLSYTSSKSMTESISGFSVGYFTQIAYAF